MGGKSKAQTIGYKYYIGMQSSLCHGPIDLITRATVDDRVAWSGSSSGGSITVSAESLFGGESREGGVSGTIDVMMGRPDQMPNSYLVAKCDPNVPAYRGVVNLVFRQCYMGNNPYLKAWRFRGQRIHVRQNGIAQWYDAKAAIYPPVITAGVTPWRYLAISRADNTNRSAPGFNDSAWAIGTSPFGNKDWTFPSPAPGENGFSQTPSTLITAANAYWIRSTVTLTKVPSTLRVEAFIDNDALFYVNGTLVATLGGATGNFYTIDISGSQLNVGDNVIAVRFQDRVASDSGNWMWFDWRLIDLSSVDMNPAHMIRECLTDPDWGMGYLESDIDDVSFTAAADALSNEGLGMSLLWDKQILIDAFIQEVIKHIDAALYVSRTTGKFVLKLIRADYDEGDLITLDESSISRIEDPSRPTFGELTNSITVNYWDAGTGKDASLTVTDTAMALVQGATINTPVQYPGFTNARNATIAGQRDLRALSSPLLNCTIYVDSTAEDLNVGDTFKLDWPKWNIYQLVMRITSFGLGNGKSNQIKLTCIQDIFDTTTKISVSVGQPSWDDPSQPPAASVDSLAIEAPYLELVQALGQANVDDALTNKPESGYVLGAMPRSQNAINGRMWTDNGDGTGYNSIVTLELCPYCELIAATGKLDTLIYTTGGTDMDQVVVGQHGQLGDEIVRIDAVDTVANTVTIGRGCLDTVPEAHDIGTPFFLWDLDSANDPTEYVDGEVIDVKIQPVSGAGVVDLSLVTERTVVMDSRAYRPYAPGDLRINGESYEPGAFYEGEVTVTWTDRNRLEQTGGTIVDHTMGDIGPEPGTEYRLRVYVDDVLDQTIEPAVSPQDVTPIGTGLVRIEVHSKRDDFYSWQAPWHTFINSNSRLTEDEDLRYTEDGDQRLVED